MARAVEAVVGIKHGKHCTCTALDPIELKVEPVLVSRDCPGQRATTRDDTLDGRVIITWPHPKGLTLDGWSLTVTDADTGEPWPNVLSARVTAEPRGIVTAVLERLVDETGAPTNTPVPGEDGERFRTALFRYAVAEMRVAEEP